jgi:ATP-dependent exoDNAse (exonuclease V) beta subunit
MNFTAAQLAAVDVSRRHSDTCIVAGPGSGKTTVLVEYFRRLVAEGVDPLRILAITFTEKAAANMRKKLAEAFHEDVELRARLERAWVSTVHGFCVRLLHENAVFAGVDPEFTVADERDSWRMQRQSITAAIEELFDQQPADVCALIRGLSAYDFEDALLSAYDAMRGAGIRVAELAAFAPPRGVVLSEIASVRDALTRDPLRNWSYPQKQHLREALEDAGRITAARSPREALEAIENFSCSLQKCKRGTEAYELASKLRKLIDDAQYTLITEHYTNERRVLLDIFARFDRIYRERKRAAGVLDFADLEEYTVGLLRHHAETQERLRRQFDHILMDEFQDTNGQQAKLLELIRRPDRFYAVGDINQSIFGFRHAEPEGFREYRDDVERRGRRVIELVENFRSRPEILRAVEAVANGSPGIEPRSLVAAREFASERPACVELMAALADDEALEAQWVARRVNELHAEFEFRDFAVLVRNTEVFAAFTSAFDAAGIQYVVNRGKGFYEAREVVDLMHLLRVIANPRDEVSMAVVLRSPLAGLSDEAMLAYFRRDHDGEPFRSRLQRWRERRDSVSFDRLLLEAIDDSGYPWTPNVDKFLAQARAASSRMPLDQFVEELALIRASNPREPDAPPEDSADAVQLMTVHSAKGLEFPVVFVAALHKGIDTDLAAIAFSRQHGLGARWRNPAGGKEKDDLFQHAIREERKIRECEESNRLLYVAMTRAEQHLVLSFSKKPANWASVVVKALGVDVTAPRDEVVTFHDWDLRLAVIDQAIGQTSRPDVDRPEGVSYTFLPRPELPPHHNTDATVSDLSLFAACPRKYYLANYLGFEGRAAKASSSTGMSAADLGTQVHGLLAGSPVANPHPDAERLAAVARQSPLARRAERAIRIEREHAFLMAVEDLVLRGQIDLWFEEGGELVLIDYKTDAVTGPEAHQRARDYEFQLRLYAMAVERIAGRAPDRAWLHFLRPNTLVEVDVTPSLLDSPEQMVRDFLDVQAKMEFPLNETEACRRCPFYRDLCPAALKN